MLHRLVMPDLLSCSGSISACEDKQWEKTLALFAESVARTLELSMNSKPILLMMCERRSVFHFNAAMLSVLGEPYSGDGLGAEHL